MREIGLPICKEALLSQLFGCQNFWLFWATVNPLSEILCCGVREKTGIGNPAKSPGTSVSLRELNI
jgi:hypothetical protein